MQNIKLKGAENIRDLGGMRADGRTLRPCRILRGSHLSAVTDNDIQILINKYKLKTVIDLRTDIEKGEKPDRRIDAVDYREMPVFDGSLPGLSHESKQDLDNIPDMTWLYSQVMTGDCLKNLACVVRYIVKNNTDGSVLYHCTEGKDRTGMVTALLLMLLGVSREDIFEDYLFTNKINRKKAIKYYLLVRIFKHNKTAAKKVYGVFLARRQYLAEGFKAVDAMGEKRFISDVLMLSDEDVNSFRERTLL